MLAVAEHDDAARQRFVLAAKGYLNRQLVPRLHDAFDRQLSRDESGAVSASFDTVLDRVHSSSAYQAWSSLNVAAQNHMWEAVKRPVVREQQRLEQGFSAASAAPRGSLTLNADIEVPDVMRSVDVHLQPGGYMLDQGPNDIQAGALYEAGGRLYSQGIGVGTRETKAEIVIRFLSEWRPGFYPGRILDMACSAGQSSTPYAAHFADADVHAVDIGPGLLRYAHARAEALGVTVHFHQANVESTGFDDASFDLVVSHNAMHELSQAAQAGMMAECYRLLRPGGVCIHLDVPLRFEHLSTLQQVLYSWDEFFNNEPFWSAYATNDAQTMLVDAGFAAADVFVGPFEQADKTFSWHLAAGQKP